MYYRTMLGTNKLSMQHYLTLSDVERSQGFYTDINNPLVIDLYAANLVEYDYDRKTFSITPDGITTLNSL